jgi:hypothetical protein
MTAPELPEPDAALLELDKLARESNCYECGLPFMASARVRTPMLRRRDGSCRQYRGEHA